MPITGNRVIQEELVKFWGCDLTPLTPKQVQIVVELFQVHQQRQQKQFPAAESPLEVPEPEYLSF